MSPVRELVVTPMRPYYVVRYCAVLDRRPSCRSIEESIRMSYPSGPPGGYPGQPPQQPGGPVFGQPPARPNPLGSLGIPGLLVLGTFVLSLVAYFVSFGGGYGIEVTILLAGGLLAGLSLLPKGPATLPYATVLSVVGGLTELDGVINSSGAKLPTSVILIMVFGLLQAVASVVALLLEHGLIKLAPRPAVPHPGYPPSGAFPGPQGYPGQQRQQPGQPQQPAQATTYMQPPPQSTQFLQHPGQLNHPSAPPE
jgi:hypothetical protein